MLPFVVNKERCIILAYLFVELKMNTELSGGIGFIFCLKYSEKARGLSPVSGVSSSVSSPVLSPSPASASPSSSSVSPSCTPAAVAAFSEHDRRRRKRTLWQLREYIKLQHNQALLKAKYCPRVAAAALCKQKTPKNSRDLDLSLMSLKFNSLRANGAIVNTCSCKIS